MRRLIGAFGAVAVAAALLLAADEARLAVKARVATRLIDHALERSRADARPHRPWPWADTWPVGRIEVPALGIRRAVLRGADGSSLAFGAGWLDGTGTLDGPGHAVIAGHRDGAFGFLEHLWPGERVVLSSWSSRRELIVVDRRVTSMWDASVVEPAPGRVTFVTCYPFDGVVPGERRFVVVLEGVPDSASVAVGRSGDPPSEVLQREVERAGDGRTNGITALGSLGLGPRPAGQSLDHRRRLVHLMLPFHGRAPSRWRSRPW